MQGNMGVLMGARQEGQTGEVIIGGPERTALSTRIVSLALIGLVAISPLPLPYIIIIIVDIIIILILTSTCPTFRGKHFVPGLCTTWWSSQQ